MVWLIELLNTRDHMSIAQNAVPLRARVLRASGWSFAGYALSQALRLASNLVMTRLLVPDMFGVMAIATMIMTALAMFSDLGLRQVIVQSRRGNDPAFLNTAWLVQILRGVLISFVAVGASVLVLFADRHTLFPRDSVYAEPSLPYVIAVLSITAIISGLSSSKTYEASRSLSLGRITQIEIAAQVAGLVCMIVWVTVDRSIWALVAGSISSTLVATILSHAWLSGFANSWQWDRGAFREIFSFGKWIFASSVLGFLVNNGDRVLLGGLLNTATLGVYVIAFLIFSSVEQVLAKIIGDVSFPALSEVARERPASLRSIYYRFHLVIASFAYFCAGALMICGQALIGLLYDQRYEQAGWMLEILSVALVALPSRVAPQCFMALGMPRLLSYMIAIRVVVLFVLTPIGFHDFGLAGALWAIVLSHLAALPLTIFYAMKYGLFDLRKEILALPSMLAGMVLAKALNLAFGY